MEGRKMQSKEEKRWMEEQRVKEVKRTLKRKMEEEAGGRHGK